MQNQSSKWAYIALTTVCFFWGTTYFFIKIGVKDISPFLFSGLRHAAAGLLICTYFFVFKKQKLPLKAELIRLFLVGILLLIFANCFVAWAEVYLPSGLTSLLCCFVPFYMLIINVLMKNTEPINRYSILGLALGLIGSVLIFSDNISMLSDVKNTLGIILTVIANMSWALGTIFMKKNKSSISPLYSAGIQMFMIGFVVIIGSVLFENHDSLQFTSDAVLALVYLIFFGSIVGFGCYFYAVSTLPTTVVSINGYVNVVVAMILASLFQNELFGLKTLFSLIITLFGVYLINLGYNKSIKKT